MSSRCRSCHGLVPAEHPIYPPPARLALLAPHARTLYELAQEWDSDEVSQGELSSAVEFARWCDFEARRAAAWGASSPTRAGYE